MVNKETQQSYLDCQQVQDQLAGYLKGGLADSAQRAMRLHLMGCDACSQALAEMRTMDAELRLEARRYRQVLDTLPAETSLRIQESVYRRMRRALFFQRTLNATQQLGTLVAVVLFLATVVLLFNPWRQQLATLATAQAPATALPLVLPAATETLPEAAPAGPSPTPIATPLPAPAGEPAEPLPAAQLPVVANQSPGEAAQEMLAAAIEADLPGLALLTTRSRPLPEAILRVWQRLSRCQGQIAPQDFAYRVMVHQGRFASVYVYQDDRYLGDIKLWLYEDGDWYLAFLNYSSFSSLKDGCLNP